MRRTAVGDNGDNVELGGQDVARMVGDGRVGARKILK